MEVMGRNARRLLELDRRDRRDWGDARYHDRDWGDARYRDRDWGDARYHDRDGHYVRDRRHY